MHLIIFFDANVPFDSLKILEKRIADLQAQLADVQIKKRVL